MHRNDTESQDNVEYAFLWIEKETYWDKEV